MLLVSHQDVIKAQLSQWKDLISTVTAINVFEYHEALISKEDSGPWEECAPPGLFLDLHPTEHKIHIITRPFSNTVIQKECLSVWVCLCSQKAILHTSIYYAYKLLCIFSYTLWKYWCPKSSTAISTSNNIAKSIYVCSGILNIQCSLKWDLSLHVNSPQNQLLFSCSLPTVKKIKVLHFFKPQAA